MKEFMAVSDLLYLVRTARLIDSVDPLADVESIINKLDKISLSDEQIQSLKEENDNSVSD